MGQLISDNKTKMSGERMTCKGTLRGHNGWITQIATTPVFPDMLLSASRDKTIIMWQLTREEGQYGIPKRRLNGHSHFVSDVVVSSATPRMSSRSPSPPITVKLSRPPVTAQSSCGILWVFASTPSRSKATPSGSHASASPPWPRTPSPSHPMDHSALPVAATVPPSCGIWAARRPSPQHYSWQCPVFLPPRLSRRHPPSEYTSAPWQLESSPKLLKCSQDSWAQWQSPDNSLLGIGLL